LGDQNENQKRLDKKNKQIETNFEEPYAGNSHVRICEGFTTRHL